MLKIVVIGLFIGALFARDPDGRYANSPHANWFKSQKSPRTGSPCCNEADGIFAEEEIRQGQYWAQWPGSFGWHQVPDEVVLRGPNPNGSPVVWWENRHGQIIIRCYAPGGGV